MMQFQTCARLPIFFVIMLHLLSRVDANVSAADISPPIQPVAVKKNLSNPKVAPHSSFAQTLKTNQQIDEVIADFNSADALAKEPQIIPLYKKLFNISSAIAPDIQVARSYKAQKSEERYTAWAQRLSPKINANVSQVREFNMEDTADTSSSEKDTNQYTHNDGEEYADWSLNLDVPVYRRKLNVQVNVAQAEEQVAENNLQITIQQFDLRLKELVGNYLESCYRLLNIQNSVLLSQEHVERIYRGYELRDQTRLQLLRAQANLKELEAKQDLDAHNKEVAFNAVLDFSGLTASNTLFQNLEQLLHDEVQIAGCINSLAAVEEKYVTLKPFVEIMDTQERQQYYFKHSLLYSKILLQRQLAEDRATTFTQDEYPDLSIRGYYDRLDDTQFTKFNGEGSLALVLSIPLFSGGTVFSTNKTKAIAQHIADVNQYTDVRSTLHTIENNRKLISSLRSIYATQQINLLQQQEIVVLSVKSYQIKQTSMQDLLTSKNRLIDAKNALMQTTNRLAALYRQFAWELGTPFPTPETEQAF